MPKKLTIELPEKTKTTKVIYADAPLRLGGSPQEITIEDLYQKVNQPFIYSDALFSREKHAPYLKKGAKPKSYASNYFLKKFEQMGFTNVSNLVICNMGSLGHGVFANKDFEPGECFILYSGIIKDKSYSKSLSAYAHGYGKELSLYVDADETGNIARFIQHMPLNYNLDIQHQQNKPTDSNNNNNNAQQNSEELADYWQWRNITYKSDLCEKDVAWANLSIMVIPLQGVPCIIFYNPRKIEKGEQLGISYGNGYWLRRNLKPELLDLQGNIIPETKYGYKEIVVDLPIIELFNQFPQFKEIGVTKSYNAEMFQRDLQRQQEAMQPVWFSHLAEPVSIFKLRELLLQYKVIGEEYAPIENEFIINLQELLPAEFKIKMFERDPHKPASRPIYDVVCTTDDLMRWSQLTLLIKNPMLAAFTSFQNKCLKLTQEVIFMDIGDRDDQSILLNTLRIAKTQGYFTQVLPQDSFPSGPTRRNPNGIIMVKAEEAISQILLHNPGLTREEINYHYEMVGALSKPTANSNTVNDHAMESTKENKLNFVTKSFFNNKTPANWKVYPHERLTGKYVGHQVRFFNMPTEYAAQATPFFNTLKQNGFETELKKANDKPSIVVDLTTSMLAHK